MSVYENAMIERYWEKEFGNKSTGTLVLKYPIVKKTTPIKDCMWGKREVDGIILPDGPKTKLRFSEVLPQSFQNQRLIVIQAKTHRLGTCLLGQTVFSPGLFARYNPKSIKSVALCGANDSELEVLIPKIISYLKPFWQQINFDGVEIETDNQVSSSLESPLECERDWVLKYFSEHVVKVNKKGVLIWNYPLIDKSPTNGHLKIRALILPEEGSNANGDILTGEKVPIAGKKVIILNTTPDFLGMWSMGLAVVLAELVRKHTPNLESVIMCKTNDNILYPMLKYFPDVKVISNPS